MMQPYGTEIKGAGLFLNPNDVKWQNIMKIYRYISTVDIKWKLNHQNIQSATDEQIRLLITQKGINDIKFFNFKFLKYKIEIKIL